MAHKVVVVGGGFGGLFAARSLKGAEFAVTLVDRHNYHLFQPLLYQVATGILSEGEIAPPIRDILRHQGNVEVELATVDDLKLLTVGVERLEKWWKPGVLCIVPGPGVTNALTGIGEALLDSIPMVCIVCDVACGAKYRPFQVHCLPNAAPTWATRCPAVSSRCSQSGAR